MTELLDARPLRVVRLVRKDGISSYVGEMAVIPSNRPLWDVLSDLTKHNLENPTHGVGCVCMDNVIRDLRAHISRAWNECVENHPDSKRWEASFKLKASMAYVLKLAARDL